MSDVSSGARAPDATPGVDVPTGPPTTPAYPATETYPAGTYSATPYGEDESTAKQVAGQTREAAGQAAAEVKDTAKEQAQRVAGEARQQARGVASELRSKASEQAHTQNDRLVGTIRQTADQLDQMRGDRADTPAAMVVSRVAEGGRQLADYLDRNGPEGVLREVQDFARRRPGAFLATALAAGFVVGRLGKSVAKADSDDGGSAKPRTDAFVSGTPDLGVDRDTTLAVDTELTRDTALTQEAPPRPGYADPLVDPAPGYTASTEYASTGTGTPVVVDEEYPDYPGRRP